MASLKDMRVRIAATKATQKITKAMQMVAASKLRRAQAAAEAARPYAERMDKVLGNIAASVAGPRLGAGAAARHRQRPRASAGRLHRRARPVRSVQLGDRAARARARQRADGRGQGGQVLLRRPQGLRAARRLYEKQIIERVELRGVRTIGFEHAETIAREDHRALRAGRVRRLHAVLLALPVGDRADPDRAADHPAGVRGEDRRRGAVYEYEPDEEEILAELLPRNIAVQMFRALLENAASEQGAQMSAMDNATRNAGEMIRKQTLTLQPHPPGDDHQGTDRDHLRRRGAVDSVRRGRQWPPRPTQSERSPRSSAPSSTCSSRITCRRS